MSNEKYMESDIGRQRVNNVKDIIEGIIVYFRSIGYEILSNIEESETENILNKITDFYERIYDDATFKGEINIDDIESGDYKLRIKNEIRKNFNKNLSIENIKTEINEFAREKEYLKAFNLITIIFYLFFDKDGDSDEITQRVTIANDLKETICSRMREDFLYYNSSKSLLLEEIKYLYSFYDKNMKGTRSNYNNK